mgnify:CR=1 FL=1
MKIKAVIWDLDGTLLNTLDDLAASTNAALLKNDLPQRTTDEVRRFVGSGVRRLIEQAVPELGEEHPKFQQVLDDFVALARELDMTILGLTFSPVKGPEGNIEFLGHLSLDDLQGIQPDTEKVVSDAHATLKG